MFVRRQPGQSWADALDAAEDDDEFGAGPAPDVWQRVVERARLLLGEVSLFVTDDCGEINHEPTSIQLDLFADSAGMSVPYGATGDGATAILQAIYLLGRIVEEETGLGGYDPQIDKPLAEAAANLNLGAASFETVAHLLRTLT
jgi:hypothetical protein